MYTNKNEIEEWLYTKHITDYIINDDLTIDVDESVDLELFDLTKIPIQFGVVNGDFSCYGNQLIDLKGCPKIVKGDFDCRSNPPLNNLNHLPYIIDGYLLCDNIESIEYKRWKLLSELRK